MWIPDMRQGVLYLATMCVPGEFGMHDVLKCNLCGKVIMILEEGGRRTICCDQLMEKLPEQSDGKGKPSHTPSIAKTRGGIIVKVGGVSDPMEESHHIAWIEISDEGARMVKTLGPGDSPEAEFPFGSPDIKVRLYCPRHGLWTNKPVELPE